MNKCKHCGGDIAIRNPSGFCDHLMYPENCDVCSTEHKCCEVCKFKCSQGYPPHLQRVLTCCHTPTNNVEVENWNKDWWDFCKLGGLHATEEAQVMEQKINARIHQATEETIDEAIATVINNSRPSNDQMNVVRALRKLKEGR